MENIQGGIIKSILNTLKSISEKLFNYLGSSDGMGHIDKHVKLDEKKVKKLDENTFEMPYTYQSDGGTPLPYKVKMKLIKDDLADITVTVSLNNEVLTADKRNVSPDKFEKVSKDLLLSMLDADTKAAFGIKESKRMNVTLRKIVASKETSIELTAIKANYGLDEAYSNLDILLDAPEFTDTITDEPISFEIQDVGDDFDINPVDVEQQEYIGYAIKEVLCAAIQFNMDIQLLRWEYARCQRLFELFGRMQWDSWSWVDKLGLWYLEVTNSVNNMLGSCSPDIPDVDITIDHSPCGEVLGLEKVYPVFDRMINAIEWTFPDFPVDMQNELGYWLRNLKQTRDFDLKQLS